MARDLEQFPEGCIGYPDEETMSCEDGLVENHHYMDMRRMTEEDFRHIIGDEKLAIEWAEQTGLSLDSDEAFAHFTRPEHENALYEWIPLEAGIASTVIALSVIGCGPVTSCAGGEGHYESHPLVVFWADEPRLELVEKAAEGLVEVCGASQPGLMVYTEVDISLMAIFAKRLMELWPISGIDPMSWPEL